MTPVATPESAVAARQRGAAKLPAPRLFEPQGPTLEDAILTTWQELASSGNAACPVCSGEMSRSGGCASCGARLS